MTDEQPVEHPAGWRRFLPPWWTLGFPLVATAGLAGWQAANAGESQAALDVFFASLLWPGGIAFVVVLVFVWLGWTLELD